MADIYKIKIGEETHNLPFLPLSGGTITGYLTINHSLEKYSKIIFKDNRIKSGGYADDIISIVDKDDVSHGHLGLYGDSTALQYLYMGHNDWNGNNLRVYKDKVSFGTNTLIHDGNIGSQSVNYASSAGSAPASDVYAWAKASTKPSYNYSEVGAPMHKLLFSKQDYQHFVVLLCKIGANTTNTCHRISGKIYTEVGGGARYQAADIDIWRSDWTTSNDGYTKFNAYGLGSAWQLITCTYNGVKWLALRHNNTQACAAYFQGTATGIDFTAIKYYTSNTSTVNNSEINNSIEVVTSYDGYSWAGHTHNYLSTSGGTITGTLEIKRNAAAIHYYNADGTSWGWMGFGDKDTPQIWDSNGVNQKTILHTGNHGSGTHISESAQTFKGTKTFNDGILIPNTGSYTCTTNSSSNWIYGIRFLKGSAASGKNYEACIGWHNTGGNGDGALTIVPHPQDAQPWGGTVGLYITGSNLKFNNVDVSLSGHTHNYIPTGGGVAIGSSSARYTNGYFSGSVYAASGFYESSDERLKDIQAPLTTDLEKLSHLRKVYFNFKEDPSKTHIGVIAQDIKELYPEIVTETDEGTLNVDYSKLSVIALDAIDILHKENVEIKKENEEIKKRLEKLESLLLNQ